MDKNISFTLKVWRQKGPKAKGAFETYTLKAKHLREDLQSSLGRMLQIAHFRALKIPIRRRMVHT